MVRNESSRICYIQVCLLFRLEEGEKRGGIEGPLQVCLLFRLEEEEKRGGGEKRRDRRTFKDLSVLIIYFLKVCICQIGSLIP
jgi:hypothetical protein